MIIWGKLGGFVIGAFSGLGIYGALVGLVLGHLVDMYLAQRKSRSLATVFYTDPGRVAVSERETFLMAVSGLAAHMSGASMEKNDYTLELVSGILKTHLSLSVKETEAVKEYTAAYLSTPKADPDAVLQVYTEAGYKAEAHLALLSALYRIEERTGITQEKTRFTGSFARGTDIPEEESSRIRRQFLGVSLENYEILGLPAEASTEEIKRTYRNLAAFFHPDGTSMLSEEQRQESGEAFIAIQKAYEAIMKERAGT